MEKEYGLARSQLKGYLFEMIIMELLRKNRFIEVNVSEEPHERVRMIRDGFIEFKGRGCWHQIDCPCDYCGLIPFSYPLRILGEVKFYRNPLQKKHIREYIGVIKDIQENYFVADGVNVQDFYPRKLEIGVFFSANGFQAEAEKLAYAHGIKTVSYENNYLINRIKVLVEELERHCLSVECMNSDVWGQFRQDFRDGIRYGYYYNSPISHAYLGGRYMRVIRDIHESLSEIRTSFIATTATGVFLHFVSESVFPERLFRETDEGSCSVYYDFDEFRNRFFWLEIIGDPHRSRFYFTPPESLDLASLYGGDIVLNEKERLFRVLNVNIDLNGISRNLILNLDSDWLDAARDNM